MHSSVRFVTSNVIVANGFSSKYHSHAAWHSFSDQISALSTSEIITGKMFERFLAVPIRLDFESTLAFSFSAFERFWAAVAIRNGFESVFRSIRWAISDQPKQVSIKKAVEE